MENKKLYIVTFGDSKPYSALFGGSREDFMKSAEFRHIKDAVYDYVREKYPDFDCEKYLAPDVRECTQRDENYADLTADNLSRLKHEVAEQVERYENNK